MPSASNVPIDEEVSVASDKGWSFGMDGISVAGKPGPYRRKGGLDAISRNSGVSTVGVPARYAPGSTE